MTRRDELERLRDAVEGAQEWLSVSRFTNAEHARAKEQLAYVIAAIDALISQEGHEQPPRFDEYRAYGENNPPVGAPSTREPTTTTLRWVWNAVPLKGHIGGPFVAEKVLQQCVRGADGNMVWQDVGEHNPPVQGGARE